MIKTETLSSYVPPRTFLEELKQYASVPDNGRDALLGRLLTQAMLKVQEMADKTILPGTMKVTETDAKGGIRLYQTPVMGTLRVYVNGSEVKGFRVEGNRVYVSGKEVTITYETKVEPSSVSELMPIVYQYATAMYDGANTTTLNAILSQC